jgi:hypothetical protein
VYAVVLADLGQALTTVATPETRIHQLYARVASMSETEFQVLRLVMREALVSSSRLQKIAARFQSGHLPLVAALIHGGVSDGSFRTDQNPLALMAAVVSLGLVPQLIHRLVSTSGVPLNKPWPSAQEAATSLGELLLHGIAGAPREHSKVASVPSRSR